jgi:hypothetical protein
MEQLNFWYKIYFWLPNFGRIGMIGKAIDRFLDIYILRIIFEKSVSKNLNYNFSDTGLNRINRGVEYIVSITSFPARIEESWISIECLLRQSIKPDKIILWLADDQFPGRRLPRKLKKMLDRGLEIRFCEDLKSHKKYYHTMLSYPNAFVITFDDDLYYDSYVLENLIKLNSAFPECISTNRAHEITFDKNGDIRPYRHWKHNVTNKQPAHTLLHTSGAGTLFPPGILSKKTFDKDNIRDLSPNSDDVWLKVMAYYSNLKVVTNNRYNKDFVTVGSTQTESLVSTNTFQGGKDIQLSNTLKFFKLIFRY